MEIANNTDQAPQAGWFEFIHCLKTFIFNAGLIFCYVSRLNRGLKLDKEGIHNFRIYI